MADVPAGLPERRPHPDNCTEKPRLERIEEHLSTTAVDIREIKDAVLGTFVKPGVCTKVRDLEAKHAVMWTRIDEVASAIVGNGKPGINERLRILEMIKARNEKLSWILIGAIAVQAAIVVKQIFVG